MRGSRLVLCDFLGSTPFFSYVTFLLNLSIVGGGCKHKMPPYVTYPYPRKASATEVKSIETVTGFCR